MSDLEARLAAARRRTRERDSEWRNPGAYVAFSESEADALWAASVAGVLAADPALICPDPEAHALVEAALAWRMFNAEWDGEWETDHDLMSAIDAYREATR